MKKKPHPMDLDARAARLVAKLDFSEGEVMQASREQASLYYEAASLRAELSRVRMRRVAQLELVRSTLFLQKRRDLIAQDEPFTLAHLNAIIITEPEYQKARCLLDRALEREEAAKLLMEAYRQRRDALRIIQEQNRAEFGIHSATSYQLLREQLKKKYPGGQEDE